MVSVSNSSPSQVAGQVVDQAQDTVGQVVEQAQHTTGQVVEQAKRQTTSRLEEQKEHIADSLFAVGHALRQTSQQLREQNQEFIAQYADKVAERVEHGSSYLRSQDVQGIVTGTEQFARRRPTLFVGAALTLGILGARFLKSSRPQAGAVPPERALVPYAPESTDMGYGADAATGYGADLADEYETGTVTGYGAGASTGYETDTTPAGIGATNAAGLNGTDGTEEALRGPREAV